MTTVATSLTSFADEPHLEQCHAYVIHHLRTRQKDDHRHEPRSGPAITISYQLGAGAHVVSRRLTELMRIGESATAAPWTVFDRELVEAVLAEQHWASSLNPIASEDYRPYMQEVLEEILELRPPSCVMTPKIEEMVRRLAQSGNVILMGHCANIIARDMSNVFHTRIVAPFEKRVGRLQKAEGWSEERAAEAVKADDRRRNLYVKRYYHSRADDGLLYHMVVNTELMGFSGAAEAIAIAARRCFSRANSGELAGV